MNGNGPQIQIIREFLISLTNMDSFNTLKKEAKEKVAL